MLINPLISRRSSCCWKLLRVQFQENKEESQYVLAGKVYRSSSIDGERNVGDSPHYHRPRSRVHSQNPQNHSLKAARPPPTIGSKSPGNSSTVEEQTSKSWETFQIQYSSCFLLTCLFCGWYWWANPRASPLLGNNFWAVSSDPIYFHINMEILMALMNQSGR